MIGPCTEFKYLPALLPARFLGEVTCVVLGQPRVAAAILKIFGVRVAFWVIVITVQQKHAGSYNTHPNNLHQINHITQKQTYLVKIIFLALSVLKKKTREN